METAFDRFDAELYRLSGTLQNQPDTSYIKRTISNFLKAHGLLGVCYGCRQVTGEMVLIPTSQGECIEAVCEDCLIECSKCRKVVFDDRTLEYLDQEYICYECYPDSY